MPRYAPASNQTCPESPAMGERQPLTRVASDDNGRSLRLTDTPMNGPSGQSVSPIPPEHENTNGCGRKHDVNASPDVKPMSRVDLGDYYPDGGWGWVILAAATLVHALCGGFHLAYGSLYLAIERKEFKTSDMGKVWLGSLGIGISLFISPFITVICRRKSPRLYGVIGGLICALGCLFLAFSTQPEQLFISHCVVMSLGSGVTIVTANIMVGRYFRRKRELAEVILVSGAGIGTALMASLFHVLLRAIDWMHGLQSVAGLLVLTIIAGAMYRSASLYHPRRKVILHLKSQKKNRREREAEKPPYLDFSALKMRSLRALMVISAVTGFGVHVPFVLLVPTAHESNVDESHLFLLSIYLGLGFVVGCAGLGYITIRNSSECYISRRHLCQTSSLLCGLFTLLVILANDETSYALYAWAYGICCGSYFYSLKTYTYELVKSKLMERAWSFLCAAQSLPILFGAPAAWYLNTTDLSKDAGYIMAGVAMIMGGLMFYTMPYFERHPSNQEILQKHSGSQYSPKITEAAALLELDLMEGATACKHNHQSKNGLTPIKFNKHSSSSSNSRSEGGGVRVQLQCIVQHKEWEKPKQVTLTKISEEKDQQRNEGCSTEGLKLGCGTCPGHVEFSVTKTDYSDSFLDGPSDSSFSNYTDKSGGKDNGGHGKVEGKKNKKNEVRVDLFDPPSQEKESTATVSYDSDLYINLCEAQV